MDDAVKNAQKSIDDAIKDRISNPFLLNYIIFWLLYNWKIVYTFLFIRDGEKTINKLSELWLSNGGIFDGTLFSVDFAEGWNNTLLLLLSKLSCFVNWGVLIPLVFSLIYIFILPPVFRFFKSYYLKQKVKDEVLIDDYNKIRPGELSNQLKLFKDELDKIKKDNLVMKASFETILKRNIEKSQNKGELDIYKGMLDNLED